MDRSVHTGDSVAKSKSNINMVTFNTVYEELVFSDHYKRGELDSHMLRCNYLRKHSFSI